MGFEVKEQLTASQKARKAKEMIQWLRTNGFAHLLTESEPSEEEDKIKDQSR